MFEYLNLELKTQRPLIVSGKLTVTDLQDPGHVVYKARSRLRAELLAILTRVRNFGIGQVNDELARQGI